MVTNVATVLAFPLFVRLLTGLVFLDSLGEILGLPVEQGYTAVSLGHLRHFVLPAGGHANHESKTFHQQICDEHGCRVKCHIVVSPEQSTATIQRRFLTGSHGGGSVSTLVHIDVPVVFSRKVELQGTGVLDQLYMNLQVVDIKLPACGDGYYDRKCDESYSFEATPLECHGSRCIVAITRREKHTWEFDFELEYKVRFVDSSNPRGVVYL